MMEAFSDEGPFVVQGYQFEPVLIANTIQTRDHRKKTVLRTES